MENQNSEHTLSCVTPGCLGKIGAGSITGLCPRCYSSIYNWTRRSSQEVINRLTQLHLFEARMYFLVPRKKVKLLTSVQKFEQLAVLPGQCGQYRKKTRYKMLPKKVAV